MRLPALLPVVFTLLLSAIANPVASIAAENSNTTGISAASESARGVQLAITFCWKPGYMTPECQVLHQEEAVCTYHYGLMNYLKGIGMNPGVHCRFFSDSNCQKDGITLGPTIDIHGSGVHFDIQSTWCYDSRDPDSGRRRSVETIESAVSTESKNATKLTDSIASQQDERLITRDDPPSVHITECFDDGACKDTIMTHNYCTVNAGAHDHLTGLILTGGVFCQIFPTDDTTCKGEKGAKGIFQSTQTLIADAPNLKFPVGSMYCWKS